MPKDTPSRGNANLREELAPDPAAVVMPATPLVTESRLAPAFSTVAPQDPADPGSEPPAEPKAAAELKAPGDHARDLKGVKTVKRAARVNGEPEEFELFHWQHAAAEALHGWKEHEHHAQKPFQLSLDDYKAALIAASNPVTRRISPETREPLKGEDGKLLDPVNSYEAAEKGWLVVTDYEPHAPALSEHKGKA